MWELYKTIQSGLPKTQEVYIIKEITTILKNINKQEFLSALSLLYKIESFEKFNPLQMALMFTRGLSENKFFEFVLVVKRM